MKGQGDVPSLMRQAVRFHADRTVLIIPDPFRVELPLPGVGGKLRDWYWTGLDSHVSGA